MSSATLLQNLQTWLTETSIGILWATRFLSFAYMKIRASNSCGKVEQGDSARGRAITPEYVEGTLSGSFPSIFITVGVLYKVVEYLECEDES